MSAPFFPRSVDATLVTRVRAGALNRASRRIEASSRERRGPVQQPWSPAPSEDQFATEGPPQTNAEPRGGNQETGQGEPPDSATILTIPNRAWKPYWDTPEPLTADESAGGIESSQEPLTRSFLRRISSSRFSKVTAAAALLSTGAAAILPPVVAYSTTARVTQEIAPLVAARTAIWIRDSEGVPLGVLPQNGELGSETGIRSPHGNADFSRALRFLETRSDYFGISPQHIVQSVGCAGWYTVWRGRRQAEASCPGGSSLLMQVSTQVRGGKAGRDAIERKGTEILDALPLSVTLPPGYSSENQLIADHLPFGTAGGRSIVGLESASLILFGRSAGQLRLAEAVILAALPKRQLALYCAQPSAQALTALGTRWTQIRQRAEYALNVAFAGDPRLSEALAELRAMPTRIGPAPLPATLTAGMTPAAACAAALDPVRRTELTDSSMRTIISREVPALPRPSGLPITEIQLATSLQRQRAFKSDVEASLHALENSQSGRWLRRLLPGAGSADVLAFTADANGVLTGFYASNARSLAHERRRLGSQSKLAALLAFAAAGLGPESTLCNRAWNGLRNGSGDLGFEDCDDPRARVSIESAFGQSLNLPILDQLRRIDPAIVARATRDAGLSDSTEDLPYAIAFGVAETTPLRVAATAAAMSHGVSGQPAIARVPRAVARYRVGDQWLEPRAEWVDLRPYFTSERARNLIALAGQAPLRGEDGTLRRIAAADLRAGEVAKSGTDSRDDNLTFAKTAVGAWHGTSWYTMIAADRGAVGRSGLNIYALAATARRYSRLT